ncbi:MAG TPA: sigma-54 dependent transcriptional regulator [Gemmatimonadaceae bacterium]|nr:sigma-54 dependent transcriptional regulator [Gemmatimonadaceae bacterium]
MKALITLTDVEPAVRLNALLEAEGVATVLASPLDNIPATAEREKPDVIVITGNLLDPQTLALVRRQLWTGAAVLGLADVGDPEAEARLRSLGFSEILTKPVPAEEAGARVMALLERRRLSEETGLYGESEPVREVLVKVTQIAPVSSTVLIEGESGTGKELVARAIHRMSPRRGKAFIAVNVGALPETLLESELFGHEKGAFTGAADRRIGRFELAHGGTIFLDEIGDVPASTQVKLLRVLEEREITRVGGVTPIPIDVRVVTATNRPLRESVERGLFRSDLYYRLNVLRIYLPPLRERRSDIVLLVRRFVQEFSNEHNKEFRGISAEAMQTLVDYSWPGNVRELRNLVESMVVLAHGREIGPADIPEGMRDGARDRLLPVHIGPVLREGERAEGRELEFIVRSLVELKLQVEELRRKVDEDHHLLTEARATDYAAMEVLGGGQSGAVSQFQGPGAYATLGPGPGRGGAITPGALGMEPLQNISAPISIILSPHMTMAEIERTAIQAALRETHGNRRKAADILDIGERTLYRKLKEYNLPLGNAGDDG